MAIYLVQHGVALDKAIDPERPLSEPGRQQVEKLASRLSQIHVPIEKIYHSGKTRASQTADLFASALAVNNVRPIQHLNPNDDVRLLATELEQNAMYVGHLPHLQKLVSCLLCDDETVRLIKFENAAVICVDEDENGYFLDWFLKPSLA